jgi:hypothetical protein
MSTTPRVVSFNFSIREGVLIQNTESSSTSVGPGHYSPRNDFSKQSHNIRARPKTTVANKSKINDSSNITPEKRKHSYGPHSL